jgi:hypothetical protein
MPVDRLGVGTVLGSPRGRERGVGRVGLKRGLADGGLTEVGSCLRFDLDREAAGLDGPVLGPS